MSLHVTLVSHVSLSSLLIFLRLSILHASSVRDAKMQVRMDAILEIWDVPTDPQ